jgi:hypothetical protein
MNLIKQLIKRTLGRQLYSQSVETDKRVEDAGRRIKNTQQPIDHDLRSRRGQHVEANELAKHSPQLKFYGQFDPPVDSFIFRHYFPDTGFKGVFVECGSYDGLTECSCKFFEETMGWTGYNLEPLPWIYQDLCRNRPGSYNFNVALSDHNGQATFQAVIHPHFGDRCTNGSLKHTEAHAKWLGDIG